MRDAAAPSPGRMRSLVEIVAEAGARGTVLPVLRSDVMVAVRRTDVPGVPDPDGTVQVHLVGTAAGPLTGDELTVRITVGAGARLAVRSAAATLALPARVTAGAAPTGPAVVRYELRVGAGGHLDLATEPLVVCRGADLVTVTDVVLDDGATAVVHEQVVLGRYGEDGGRWRGRTVADVAGRPALRHTLDSTVLPGRALVSRLDLGGDPGPAADTGIAAAVAREPDSAVLLPLAVDGTLTTAVAADLGAATAALAAVGAAPPTRELSA